MIKLNKQVHKRSSTIANGLTVAIGAAMIYIPDMFPAEYVPYVMCACGVTVSLCQMVTKDAKQD